MPKKAKKVTEKAEVQVKDEGSVSLAVKHRPISFEEVVGQDFVISSVKGMLQRSLAPTILIAGPHGTGKTTIARLIALYVNCADRDEAGEPCRECWSCKATLKAIKGRSSHPDLIELNVGLQGGIDEIRNLKSIESMRPRSRRRIFILDEAQGITSAAFKGALKVFEDPSPRTMFILCTTEPEKIPSQIRGRCQIYTTKPVAAKLIAKRLYQIAKREKVELEKKQLQQVCLQCAEAVDGHVRNGVSLLESIINHLHARPGVEITAEELEKAIEESPAFAPYLIVKKYVGGILVSSGRHAFLAISLAQNHDYFLKQVIKTFRQILHNWIDQTNLADKQMNWLLKDLPYIPPDVGRKLLKSTSEFEDVLEELVKAQERLKTYLSDSAAILEVATLRILKITHNWEQYIPKDS